ncbi:MoaD/ThiS family protein [Haladaptatus sp. DJG-WS-42]|uniref:MoaD/ThiS family protein n=1 Tax=Haladaptatus sp. DJG-WS-42 TaxID=3120516 RepID=UPI0030CF178F
MPECSYCDEAFSSADAYHDHLRSDHAAELGPIDRRRVGLTEDEPTATDVAPYALVVVILAVAGVIGYVTFFAGSDNIQPTNLGGAHFHGPITAEIGGDRLDFSQSRFQNQDRAFHFEGGDGSQWHGHANQITLKYAMDTLNISVTEASVSYDGTTYAQANGDTVRVQVNGESVNPAEYLLQEGDRITIIARRG